MVSPSTTGRSIPRAASIVSALWLAGCALPVGAPPASLRQVWLFGIERMRGDVEPQLPYTNRMIADLAAMPNVQVVFLGEYRNEQAFESWRGSKLRVSPWLHGEGNCMNITYTILQSGQQQPAFGLAIPPLAAGQESDPACVDRATTEFYQALAIQGL